MGKENIDSIMRDLERHANRVSRFAHVAIGTKELSEEMLVDLGRLRVELNKTKSEDDTPWIVNFKEVIKDLRDYSEELKISGDEDKDVWEMYLDDANDLEVVLDLMLEGKLDAATKAAAYMDTASRENIPELAWEILQSHY
jgi:hypothetical protein